MHGAHCRVDGATAHTGHGGLRPVSSCLTRTRSPNRYATSSTTYLPWPEQAQLTLASEVFDRRRFGSATAFMGFTGLVPSEYSSGESVCRGQYPAPRSRPVTVSPQCAVARDLVSGPFDVL